jgi:hypothetical protein
MTVEFGTWTFREYSLSDEMLVEARAAGIEPIRFINNDGSVPVTSGDTKICTVDCQAPFKRGHGHRAECEQRDANARLIAAAPDLLEALRAVLESGLLHGPTTLHDKTLFTVHAAVSKAEGGE